MIARVRRGFVTPKGDSHGRLEVDRLCRHALPPAHPVLRCSFVLLRSLGLGVAILAAAGCSSSTDDASSAASVSTIPGTPTAASGNIELRSDVKQMDAAAWDAMVMPHDGPNVWVKLDARGADWLTPGAVTVIKGRGVLKVGSVKEDGDHLVVERVPFDLGEFMENGKIAIQGTTVFDTPFDDDASEFDVRDNARLLRRRHAARRRCAGAERGVAPAAGAAPARLARRRRVMR